MLFGVFCRLSRFSCLFCGFLQLLGSLLKFLIYLGIASLGVLLDFGNILGDLFCRIGGDFGGRLYLLRSFFKNLIKVAGYLLRLLSGLPGCLLCLFGGLLLFCAGLRCLFRLGGLVFDLLFGLLQLGDFFLQFLQ